MIVCFDVLDISIIITVSAVEFIVGMTGVSFYTISFCDILTTKST